jgi:hypothetical protein
MTAHHVSVFIERRSFANPVAHRDIERERLVGAGI